MGWLRKLFLKEEGPPARALHLGRNDPCWCGSGKKYKKCHAESDRAYFARRFTSGCTGGG